MKNPPVLSVAICVHNPKEHLLEKIIERLQRQSLPFKDWEFIIIDNASGNPLQTGKWASWHPGGKILREPRLGLANARQLAFLSAQTPWIAFVDDDNLLDDDYLSESVRIINNFSRLGVFGSSSITPDFEASPSLEMARYLPFLALREGPERWSNGYDFDAFPCGAGLVIRREIGLNVYNSEAVGSLAYGRVGRNLSSGDDTDMVMEAVKMGLGTGVFPQLKLTHYIPSSRVDPTYLRRLAAGIAGSLQRLKFERGLEMPSFSAFAKNVIRLASAYLIGGEAGRMQRIILWQTLGVHWSYLKNK